MDLVTGGTGFVGSHVVRALLAEGRSVRCLARAESRRDNLEGLPVEIAVGDLTDAASLARALSGVHTLYHVAADYRLWAKDPQELYRANAGGTESILAAAAAAGVTKVVYTSSVAALGLNDDGSPGDETTPVARERIIGHYKKSKYDAEQVAERWAAKGLPVVIVNPSTPIGERDIKPTPTGQLIVDFLNRKLPAYVDTGLNLVDVRDVAAGHLAAAEKGRPGERYILGNRNMTLKEILDALARLTGLPAPTVRLAPLDPALGRGGLDRVVGPDRQARPASRSRACACPPIGCSSMPPRPCASSDCRRRRSRSRLRARSPGSGRRDMSGDSRTRVLIVTAMPEERDAFRRHGGFSRDVAVAATGVGPRNAARAAAALCAEARPAILVGAGVAGALSEDLGVGDIFVARRVLDAAGDAPPPDPQLTARASRDAGIAHRDPGLGRAPARHRLRESRLGRKGRRTRGRGHGVGRLGAHGRGSTAFPTSSSGPSATVPATSFPDIFRDCMDRHGGIRRWQVALHALAQPSTIRVLRSMQRRVEDCTDRLAAFVEHFLAGTA